MQNKSCKRWISCTLILLLLLSGFVFSFPVQAEEMVNLALNKTVEVSEEAVAGGATMAKNWAVDGSIAVSSYKNTWGLEGPSGWIVIDLGEKTDFTQMVVYEFKNKKAEGYTLEISDDKTDWIKVSEGTGTLASETTSMTNINKGTISLQQKAAARYVKLSITKVTKWVQIAEIEIYNAPISFVQPEGNLALGKTATANQSYSSGGKNTNPAKVTDGIISVDTWTKTWGVAEAGDNITIDFGAVYSFRQVIVYEYSAQRAQGYLLQISDDNAQWETVSESNDILSPIPTGISANATIYAGDIRLSEEKNARYLKLTINES